MTTARSYSFIVSNGVCLKFQTFNKKATMKRLAIIVPCYNEQEVLVNTTGQLIAALERLRNEKMIEEGRIVYVDDGSRDRTWELIEEQAIASPLVMGIKLAHNAGHQHALWAGMERSVAWADAMITIDADLQDDVSAIFQMVQLFDKGIDIVFGVRKAREVDTFFKRATAQGFYRLFQKMGGEVVYNHADFRLMSKRATRSLLLYPERNLFLRGLVCTLGYPVANVYYDRKPRLMGKSKYPLRKMLSFAIEGITSFSIRPLLFISYIGLFCIVVSILAIVYGLFSYTSGRSIPGWASLMVSMWFIGGAILLACGVIGEYVGKIYIEVKRRPRYLVERETGSTPSSGEIVENR